MSSTLSKEIIASISNGTHGDPFAVLGLAPVKDFGKEKLVEQALRPEAKAISVNIGSAKPLALDKISDEGLFEVIIPSI